MTQKQDSKNQNEVNSREYHDVENASSISRFFLLRPTFGVLLTFLLVAGGFFAYDSMVKESFPDLAIPQATVRTEWVGADPETIEQEITDEIEKNVKSLKGLKSVRSASFDSYSVIAVEFAADADLDESMRLLREEVRNSEPNLPQAAEEPTIDQVSVDDRPILTISLIGDLSPTILGKAADDLKERLEKVSGINKVNIGGKRDEVIQVQLIPNRIIALGISPTEVRNRIQAANLDTPLDEIENREIGATLSLYGRFRTIEDLGSLPVIRLDEGQGRVVRLREIASITRDLERETSRVSISWNGSRFKNSIDISMTKSPGADTVQIIDNAKSAIEQAKKSSEWPYGMEYRVMSDQSDEIWDSLEGVLINGLQAMFFVFLVLFIMLSWKEGIIAGLSIPLTFLGALTVVWALGYTINQMVIIGMVLALGLLVDVFILMMEGMHEGIFIEKLGFGQAALKTVRTYAVPAFAGQATTILAMAPLMAIGGISGKFIRILPISVIICLALSLIVALLVDIPLSRYLFSSKKNRENKMSRVDHITQNLSKRLTEWNLRWTVRSRKTALLWTIGAIFFFVLSMVAASSLPSLLYPKTDGRRLGVTVELAPNSTLDASQKVADELGEVLREKDYFESIVKFVGQKSPFSSKSISDSLNPTQNSHFIGFSAMFVEEDKRDKLAFEYLDSLRSELESTLGKYPGTRLLLTPETGGASTEAPIQIDITGKDMNILRRISTEVQSALRQIPGATDINDNLGTSRADIKLIPRREALDFYGISQDNLASQIRFAMTSDNIGKFAVAGTEEDLDIKMGMAWPSREGKTGGPKRLEELAMIRAFKPDGTTVPLLSVLEPRFGEASQSITHKGGERTVSVTAETENRTVNEILNDFTPVLNSMQKSWSKGYEYRIGGEAESTAETFASAGKMLVIALFLVFALLVLQFSSFTQPFIILFTILFAMIGTFFGFFSLGIPLSFPAMIGIIALIGIVVNDTIIMIVTMNSHLKNGLSVKEAAARGATDRLRPIVTTTVTTVLGLIPLALSDEFWMPLCSAIIFGLIAATVISQVVIPCLYLLLTRKQPGTAANEASGNI